MINNQHIIVLDKPVRKWDEGLPLGNGRMGAMVMGKVNDETIIINEETLWYGPKRTRKNPEARKNIPQIRKLILEGKLQEAAFLAKLSMTSVPKYNNPYQPAGDLRLSFMGHKGKVQDYKSVLDLDRAIATVSYKMGAVSYQREILVSSRYQVLAIRLTCDETDGMTLAINVNRKPFEEKTGKLDGHTVGNWGRNGVGGVKYLTAARMTAQSGKVGIKGDFVYVKQAKTIVIYLTTVTDFDKKKDLKDWCLKKLDAAEEAGYDTIRAEHIKDFTRLYGRAQLSINNSPVPSLSTGKQLELLREGDDTCFNYLTELLFCYAKYLMIGSSYQCEMPSNLQGIWNGDFAPPWQSQYTININTEMNYWFVDKCNLPECNLPLFHLIDRLVESGRKTAKEVYGCRGFCAHHNTNLWASTDMEGIFDSSPYWVMGGAWLSLHMYEHYLYSGDIGFLKTRALPVMKEAVRFFEDYLYEDKDGRLLTGPCVSPENTYRSFTGEEGAICMAPAMDSMIVRQLFTWYLEGCRITGSEDECREVRDMLEKLPETKISKDGRIPEWYEEYEEVEPGHRHISHLYGLHPGNEITKEKEDLFKAAEKTLACRLSNGGGHTGWSRAWITCFYARLGKSDAMLDNLKELLKHSIQLNLLDIHPPFQIDGNFGIAEAILESLIQSHGGYIELLPALPGEWKEGSLKGIRLRGGMTADLEWRDGKLSYCEILPDRDCEVAVRYGTCRKTLELKGKKTTKLCMEKDDLIIK